MSDGGEKKSDGKHSRCGEQDTYADGQNRAFDLYMINHFSGGQQNGNAHQRHDKIDEDLRRHDTFLANRRSVKPFIDFPLFITR